MLMSWPDGPRTALHLQGRCRDLLTPATGVPVALAQCDLSAVTSPEREIERIEADPPVAAVQRLIGCRAGSRLRASIAEELPDEIERGTPLHLLLDDLAGSTLIAGFAYLRWIDHIPELKERIARAPRPVMRDICSGFRDGSSALDDDGSISGARHNVANVPPIADPGDPIGWHELGDHPALAMRRARRIDLWAEDDVSIGIDAMFRDSCWDPDGTEVAIHEYQLLARTDRRAGTLTDVTAHPRVLPYRECPAAAPNARWMVGTELRAMRRQVLGRLRGPDCCTHLNDALRALAEVPVLAASLPRI
jgi:hypothetical protein